MEKFTREELQKIMKKAELIAKAKYIPYAVAEAELRAYERLADAANVVDAFIAREATGGMKFGEE